jgi:DNA repair exonuclease SbcCD nuclease subunit
MTKILHLSDTHLGNRQYGSDTRRDDFTRAFDAAIDRALDENVDAVIHTGDLFHRRTPSLPIVTDYIEILRKLADEDIPFYGIVGNHDRKMDQQWLDLIRETGTAKRLDQTPTMVNDDVALYGIDAVTKPAWHAQISHSKKHRTLTRSDCWVSTNSSNRSCPSSMQTTT